MNEYTNLIEAIRQIGLEVRKNYKDVLKSKNKIASGRLFDSIEYKLVVNEKDITLYFVALDYYIHIEDGSKYSGKYPPPIKAIKKWMLQKGIEASNEIAYKIQRSIYKKGIKETPILKTIRTLQNNKAGYTELLQEAFEKDVAIIIEKQNSKEL